MVAVHRLTPATQSLHHRELSEERESQMFRTYEGATLVTDEGSVHQSEGVSAFVVPGREISGDISLIFDSPGRNTRLTVGCRICDLKTSDQTYQSRLHFLSFLSQRIKQLQSLLFLLAKFLFQRGKEERGQEEKYYQAGGLHCSLTDSRQTTTVELLEKLLFAIISINIF